MGWLSRWRKKKVPKEPVCAVCDTITTRKEKGFYMCSECAKDFQVILIAGSDAFVLDAKPVLDIDYEEPTDENS